MKRHVIILAVTLSLLLLASLLSMGTVAAFSREGRRNIMIRNQNSESDPPELRISDLDFNSNLPTIVPWWNSESDPPEFW